MTKSNILALFLLLLVSCKEKELILNNSTNKDTQGKSSGQAKSLYWRKTLFKNLKITGINDKSSRYNKLMLKSKKLTKNFKDTFELEVVKSRVYGISDPENKFTFKHNGSKYTISLVRVPHEYRTYLLSEDYSNKTSYYNLGSYREEETVKLESIAKRFEEYKFSLPVMKYILYFINNVDDPNKDFKSAWPSYVINNPNDSLEIPRPLILLDTIALQKEINIMFRDLTTNSLKEILKMKDLEFVEFQKSDRTDKQDFIKTKTLEYIYSSNEYKLKLQQYANHVVGTRFFSLTETKKLFGFIYVARWENAMSQKFGQKFKSIQKANEDQKWLECKICDKKENQVVSRFTEVGRYLNPKDAKDTITSLFDFSVIRSREAQYKVLCLRRKSASDTTESARDSLFINDLLPANLLDLVSAMGKKLWHESQKDLIFSKNVTNRLQNDLKVNFIRIKTNSITDSLISTYELDFGTAATVGLKQKNIPIYDGNTGEQLANTYIEIQDVHIFTDNNRISDLTITGHLIENGIDMGLRVITNSDYSLSFEGLNKDYFSIIFFGQSGEKYLLRYSDVLFYKPTRGAFSYLVKNQETILCPTKKQNCFELDRRSLYDYLSLRVFLDPFAFLSKMPSGLTLFEGNVTLPSNIKNYKRWTRLDQVTAKFDYILASVAGNDAINDRIIKGILDPNDTVNTGDLTVNTIDNLDLFRKYYYKFEYFQSLGQLENKRTSQWTHLELGFLAIGSRASLFKTQIDSSGSIAISDTINRNLHLFAPTLRIRGELRPDAIFGLNWSAGLMYIGNLSKGNNSYFNENNPNFIRGRNSGQNYVVNYELNFYAILSKNATGGLFFKHCGYLARYTKGTWGYFPQVLVGYATNINAFIKTVQKKPAAETK